MFLVENAETFLKYGCPATQDLCKQFITVASAILAFSLTMSQRFALRSRTRKAFRRLLGAAWACLLATIIAYGIALTLISMAGYHATAGWEFSSLEQWSYFWTGIGGSAFVVGLIALIGDAFMRVTDVDPEKSST